MQKYIMWTQFLRFTCSAIITVFFNKLFSYLILSATIFAFIWTWNSGGSGHQCTFISSYVSVICSANTVCIYTVCIYCTVLLHQLLSSIQVSDLIIFSKQWCSQYGSSGQPLCIGLERLNFQNCANSKFYLFYLRVFIEC